jgi:hypothetical protein
VGTAFSDNNEHHRFETSIADLETKSGFGFLQHAVPISRGVRYAVVDVEVSFLYRVEILPDNCPDVRTVVSDTLAFLQNYRRALVETPAFARMQWEVTRAASLSRSRLPVARLDGAARRLCKMNKGTIMLK